MELRVAKLKDDFNNIITVRNEVKNVFDILQVRIDKLREIYSEFIKSNKNEMFVFSLDSFHFQSKLIDIEYDDMKRLFLAINNRMYCEYFKLHKIIVEYISNNISDKKTTDLIKINKYPTYKDLEPFKEYSFETILDMHENILNLLGIIISILSNKENELLIHKTKQNIGLNIDNFITTFNYNNSVMREKIVLFITYIEFFHKMHSKYLKRFSNKIQLMYTHINNDIKFGDSVEISKDKKRELINEFSSNDIDKNLLKELKISIGSETNSEAESEEFKSDVISTDNVSKLGSPLELEVNSKSVKRGFKNMIQKSVAKISNILSISKPKQTISPNPNLSNEELEQIFSVINKSCDSIIFDDLNSVGINLENNDGESIYNSSPNSTRNEVDEIANYITEDNFDNIQLTEDISENVIIANEVSPNEVSPNEVSTSELELNIVETINNIVEEQNEEELKQNEINEESSKPAEIKKRKYNRKKKT